MAEKNHPVLARSEWKHTNGNTYIVIALANIQSDKPEYPVTVIYQNYKNHTVWTRPLDDWHRSMTFVKQH